MSKGFSDLESTLRKHQGASTPWPRDYTIMEGGVLFRITFCHIGFIGCSVSEIRAWGERSDKLEGMAGPFLDFCKSVDYLLEPLVVSELDTESHSVLIRSGPPGRDDRGEGVYRYYEIKAQFDSRIDLSMRRYQVTSMRRPVNDVMHFTREALHMLVDDISFLVNSL